MMPAKRKKVFHETQKGGQKITGKRKKGTGKERRPSLPTRG